MKKSKLDQIKVDLIYTWCDGSDPVFKAKKEAAQGKASVKKNNEINGSHHIMQADELMYALRSAEKNLPWINKIYIIVDEQKPTFLKTSNKKIRLVDLKEIFPADALPNFNTNAIETVMGHIEGLSEHFLLASDDMMVNKPLPKSYFFTEDGKPIIRICHWKNNPKIWYTLILFVCNCEIQNKVTLKNVQDSHNMTSYVKSDYNNLIATSKYKKVFEATVYSQFRSYFNIQKVFIFLLLAQENKVVIKDLGWVASFKRLREQAYAEWKYRFVINLFRPNLFCLNASKKQSPEEIKNVRNYLAKKFPEKSQFEK